MVIFIEGLDRCGKDTQISALKNHFNKDIFCTLHYSNVKHKTNKETLEYSKKLYSNMFDIINFQDSLECSTILNRSHIGECVYSPMYRNYSGEYVFTLESNMLHVADQFLFTFIDEPENLISRDDGLSFSTDLEKKKQEVELFISAHNKSNISNKLLVNINNKSIEEVTHLIVNFIEQKLQRT